MKTDQKLTAMDILDSFYVKSEKNEIDELRLMEYAEKKAQNACISGSERRIVP